MSIQIECGACGKQLKVRDDAAGKKVRCPDCGEAISIPIPEAEPEPGDVDSNPFASGDVSSEGETEKNKRPCPACGEMIMKSASRCRYCDEELDAQGRSRPSQGRRSSRNRSEGNGYPVADLGKRLLGAIADGVSGVFFVGPGVGMMVTGLASNSDDPPPIFFVGLLLILLGALSLIAMNIYLLATRSQSIGKYFVRTQIFDVETDTPASFVKTFLLRGVVNQMIGGIPLIGPFYAIADILFIFGEEHRCLHDQIAGTYVVDISDAT